MHILHISKYTHPERGGIETFVKDLTKEQIRQGHTASVLCHHVKPLKKTDIRQIDGITVTRTGSFCNTAFAPLSPLFPLHFRREIRERPPQIIHLHLPNPAVLFSAFFPTEIPLVIHWHADVQGSPNKLIRALYPTYRHFEQCSLKLSRHIIATSPPYLESSQSLNGWRNKCSVIPLGIGQAPCPPNNAIKKPEKPLFLSVGRFSFYKGFEHLVHAATLVPEADIIIAGDGPEHSRIAREVEKHNLSSRVLLPGKISDRQLTNLFQVATAFCLPSVDRGEAFGVVLLEAMRHGLPLVSTSIPGSGTSWVNQNNITGKVVQPASPEALAKAFKYIIKNPDKAVRYGQAGRQRLEDNFTITKIAQSITQIYQQAVE